MEEHKPCPFGLSDIDYHELKRDITVARRIVENGIVQYRKRKLALRNKKQLDDPEAAYTELNDYSSQEDIRDAYGYELISEAEMDRLMGLWEGRERMRDARGKYNDRVTEMLEIAYRGIGESYLEQIYAYEDSIKARRKVNNGTSRTD